jgi:hypothetical protein
MEDKDGIILLEREKTWKGCLIGIDVIYGCGSSVRWDRAVSKKTFERWVHKKRAGICFAKQFINDLGVR